mmetsp:Transcript_2934/g.7087  ORF Transcript_2934/g.7087 Transcript_2934/m.7087 type:complete len:241 (-) Transcript_2934:874-1596(-)
MLTMLSAAPAPAPAMEATAPSLLLLLLRILLFLLIMLSMIFMLRIGALWLETRSPSSELGAGSEHLSLAMGDMLGDIVLRPCPIEEGTLAVDLDEADAAVDRFAANGAFNFCRRQQRLETYTVKKVDPMTRRHAPSMMFVAIVSSSALFAIEVNCRWMDTAGMATAILMPTKTKTCQMPLKRRNWPAATSVKQNTRGQNVKIHIKSCRKFRPACTQNSSYCNLTIASTAGGATTVKPRKT